MDNQFNTRILVIDDDENVRINFREILQPEIKPNQYTEKLKDAGAALFNTHTSETPQIPKRSSATFEFELNEASNGKQGYQMIKNAIEKDQPYAAIFVDMRMPEWDGLETVEHIRKIDEKAEIIFVTAYSDHSIEEIVTTVGTNISYHCKPFSAAEIEQIATKSVYEWNKTRNLEKLILNISQLRIQHWEMDTLLNNVLIQVAYMIGTHSALIAVKRNDRYEKELAIGNLCDENESQKYLQHIPFDLEAEVYQDDDFAYFKIEKYGILAIFEKDGKPLNTERMYLVRLFLEQAALAIKNVKLQDELTRKEKLSAIGQAVSMLFHDLRNSAGSVGAMVEIAKRHIEEHDKVLKMLDSIERSSENGVKMASDIMDFVNSKPLEKYPIQLSDIIPYIRENLNGLPIEPQTITTLCTSPQARFMGDFSKITRTLLNLIRNSAEALSEAQHEHPTIMLHISHETDKIIFMVADNGPGIPDEIREQMFIPFATFGKTKGTGLGLAIAKRFVEDHGGTITVNSSAESGTEFIIEIPASD